MADTQQAKAEKPGEQAEGNRAPKQAGPKWIADSYDGCVVIHDVEGESVTLGAGDQVPEGHEGKVGPHIPTTDAKPRSARIRDLDSTLPNDQGEDPGFNPGDHKVDDVITFIQANPQHTQRVLDLERAGKNRPAVFKKLGA